MSSIRDSTVLPVRYELTSNKMMARALLHAKEMMDVRSIVQRSSFQFDNFAFDFQKILSCTLFRN